MDHHRSEHPLGRRREEHRSFTPSRRAVLTSACASAAALVLVAAGAVASSRAEATLEVDGVSMPVTAWGGTVASLLSSTGVEVGAHDLVQPALDSRVPDGGTVIVRTAHPYTLDVDGSQRTVWSTSASADAVLADTAALGESVALAADRSGARGALLPVVSCSREVTVLADGLERQARAEGGESVDEVVEKAGVALHPIDRVSVAAGEGGSLEVRVSRVVRGESSGQVAIPFTEIEEESPDLFEGESKITRPGSDGLAARTQWAETIDGVATSSATTGEEILVQPLDQIRSTGTKKATPQALLLAGIDPKAGLESGTDENGAPYTAYKAPIGSLSSQADIEALINAMTEQSDKIKAAGAALKAGMSVTYTGQDPQEIAHIQVAARGWSDAEFQCLVNLWNRESRWNPYAQNASSGAYGIPQALPGSKMASAGADWQTNPATQITWGLGYIAGRYGTPCAAWGHSNAVGWY